MTGRHRGGRSLRRRLVVAVLASALGRGYEGRHRLIEAVLGGSAGLARPAVILPSAVDDAATTAPLGQTVVAVDAAAAPALPVARPWDQPVPSAARGSVAPWLTVVSTPPQPDLLADTVPHPVVLLFPLPPAEDGTAVAADQAEDEVFARLESEREDDVTADLAGGGVLRLYRPRHTA